MMFLWRRFNATRKEGGYSHEKAYRFPYGQKPDAQPSGRGNVPLVAESAPVTDFSQAGRNPETRK
jgi:hypothetical protein